MRSLNSYLRRAGVAALVVPVLVFLPEVQGVSLEATQRRLGIA